MTIRIIVVITIFAIWTIRNYITRWENLLDETSLTDDVPDFVFFPVHALEIFPRCAWFPAIICGILYLIFC